MRAQMSFFTSKNAARSTALALVIGLAGFSIDARAFEVSEAAKEACTPDAFRLCGAYIPDSDRVAACMQANVPNLSPPCRAVFQQQPGPNAAEVPRRRVRRITTSYDHKVHHYRRDDDRRGTWARD